MPSFSLALGASGSAAQLAASFRVAPGASGSAAQLAASCLGADPCTLHRRVGLRRHTLGSSAEGPAKPRGRRLSRPEHGVARRVPCLAAALREVVHVLVGTLAPSEARAAPLDELRPLVDVRVELACVVLRVVAEAADAGAASTAVLAGLSDAAEGQHPLQVVHALLPVVSVSAHGSSVRLIDALSVLRRAASVSADVILLAPLLLTASAWWQCGSLCIDLLLNCGPIG